MAPLSWSPQGGDVTVKDERGNRESVQEARERGERCMKTESRGGSGGERVRRSVEGKSAESHDARGGRLCGFQAGYLSTTGGGHIRRADVGVVDLRGVLG